MPGSPAKGLKTENKNLVVDKFEESERPGVCRASGFMLLLRCDALAKTSLIVG